MTLISSQMEALVSVRPGQVTAAEVEGSCRFFWPGRLWCDTRVPDVAQMCTRCHGNRPSPQMTQRPAARFSFSLSLHKPALLNTKEISKRNQIVAVFETRSSAAHLNLEGSQNGGGVTQGSERLWS